MDIKKIMHELARTNLGSYEWRALMFILGNPDLEELEGVSFKLEDVSKATGIIVPHVSRAITRLIERGIVQRMTMAGVSVYSINEDSIHWRSSLVDRGYKADVPVEITERFEKWWENYPKNIYYEDARISYIKLVQGGVPMEDLDKALMGYLNYLKERAKRQGRDIDYEFCLYPTTFLNGRWKDFVSMWNYKPPVRL